MPVSKSYTFFVKEHADTEQIVVEHSEGCRESTEERTTCLYAYPVLLCEDLTALTGKRTGVESGWLNQWQSMNKIAKKHLFSDSDYEGTVTEGGAVRILMDQMPDESSLYVGNSMAIRDVDACYKANSKSIELLGNRGVNGIDGMVSSALGAAATGKEVTLLLGDLSFFHDMNGLLTAKHYAIDMTILLINNNGGGIFSFLPQAKD